MKRKRYRTKFVYGKGRVEILLMSYSDAPGLAYVWVGTKKPHTIGPTMDFTLEPCCAVALAKAILAMAKK